MIGALVFLFRIVVGLAILAVTWFVFDNIHDRNTEIIMATLGLLYTFIFVISRRLQYFGLTIFLEMETEQSYQDHLLIGLRPKSSMVVQEQKLCTEQLGLTLTMDLCN